jgi:hypothetical protein
MACDTTRERVMPEAVRCIIAASSCNIRCKENRHSDRYCALSRAASTPAVAKPFAALRVSSRLDDWTPLAWV